MSTKSLSGVWNGVAKLTLTEDPAIYIKIHLTPTVIAQMGPHLTGISRTDLELSPAVASLIGNAHENLETDDPLIGTCQGAAVKITIQTSTHSQLHLHGHVTPDGERIGGSCSSLSTVDEFVARPFEGHFFLTRHTDPDPAEHITTERDLSLSL